MVDILLVVNILLLSLFAFKMFSVVIPTALFKQASRSIDFLLIRNSVRISFLALYVFSSLIISAPAPTVTI